MWQNSPTNNVTENISSTVGGKIEIHLGDINGQVIGALNVTPTCGW